MLSSKMASLDQGDPSVTDSKKRSIDEHVGDDIIFEGYVSSLFYLQGHKDF